MLRQEASHHRRRDASSASSSLPSRVEKSIAKGSILRNGNECCHHCDEYGGDNRYVGRLVILLGDDTANTVAEWSSVHLSVEYIWLGTRTENRSENTTTFNDGLAHNNHLILKNNGLQR